MIVIFCLVVGVPKGKNKVEIQATPSEAVILEITEQRSGMVTYGRKWIYFRLYESGRAVYQDLKKTEQDNRLVSVRLEITLNNQEHQELLHLLESPDFLNAREVYPKLWDGIDAVFTTTVWYKGKRHSKQITMINYTDTHDKSKTYYPKSLIALMQRIEAITKSRM
jgi:hypothetical protein